MTDKYIIKKDENNKIQIHFNNLRINNKLNRHTYLNNNAEKRLKVLFNRYNWKEVMQASLESITLPEGTESIIGVNYTDLTFNFLTINMEEVTIPLTGGNIEECVKNVFNPFVFRTNYPEGYLTPYVADFVCGVLYMLYDDAEVIDSLITEARKPTGDEEETGGDNREPVTDLITPEDFYNRTKWSNFDGDELTSEDFTTVYDSANPETAQIKINGTTALYTGVNYEDLVGYEVNFKIKAELDGRWGFFNKVDTYGNYVTIEGDDSLIYKKEEVNVHDEGYNLDGEHVPCVNGEVNVRFIINEDSFDVQINETTPYRLQNTEESSDKDLNNLLLIFESYDKEITVRLGEIYRIEG